MRAPFTPDTLLLFPETSRIRFRQGNELRLSESDKLTECLCKSAIKKFHSRRIRTDMSDGDMDWEEDFYILRKFWCPAVLIENFFMDSRSNLEYLPSRAGKQAVVDTHVEGIVEYLSL